MPVRKRIADFFDELGEFGIALARHWMGFVTGGAVMALGLALYERFAKPIPIFYYLGMLFIGFLVAAYLAWLEEYRRREPNVISSDPRMRLQSELMLLSGQIARLLDDRAPSAEGLEDGLKRYLDAATFGGREEAERRLEEHNAAKRALESATMDLYDSRFAQKVINARGDLSNYGFSGDEMDRIATYPRTPRQAREVADALAVLSERLGASERNVIPEVQSYAISATSDGTSTGLFVGVSVRNIGPPTILDQWQLVVRLPSGETARGKLLWIEGDAKINLDHLRRDSPVLTANDMLYLKTLQPIPTGGIATGALPFVVPFGKDRVSQHGTRLTITCRDAWMRMHDVEASIK